MGSCVRPAGLFLIRLSAVSICEVSKELLAPFRLQHSHTLSPPCHNPAVHAANTPIPPSHNGRCPSPPYTHAHSGPLRYDLAPGGRWVYHRDQRDLVVQLQQELEGLVGAPIQLE